MLVRVPIRTERGKTSKEDEEGFICPIIVNKSLSDIGENAVNISGHLGSREEEPAKISDLKSITLFQMIEKSSSILRRG